MFVSSSLALLLTTVPLHGGPAPPAPGTLVRAIELATLARVGRQAAVSVGELSGVQLTEEALALVATPDPSGRIGGPVRFVLVDVAPGRRRLRVGEATARVQVSALAVRASRAIARGTMLTADDVVAQETDLSGRPFRPVLAIDSVIGGRAVHDMAEGALVTHGDVAPAPLVRAGDLVRATARVGAVEVSNEVVAAESGLRDEVIRVVNQDSRRVLRARVTGRGEVEVVNVR